MDRPKTKPNNSLFSDNNAAHNIFLSTFNLHYNLSFPLVSISKNKKLISMNPFMFNALLKCRNKKQELSRLAKDDPSPYKREKCQKYRNIYNECLVGAKKIHARTKIKAAGKDSKAIWATLKDTMDIHFKGNHIEQINVNGNSITGPI